MGDDQARRHYPPPDPPPVTTIVWRMVHIGADCFAARTSAFFGDPPDGRPSDLPDDVPVTDPRHRPTDLPSSAADGVAFLERTYQQWRDHIAALTDAGLTAPLGPKAGPFSHNPMAGLILHINREVIHHGGEIGVLRDLHRAGLAGR